MAKKHCSGGTGIVSYCVYRCHAIPTIYFRVKSSVGDPDPHVFGPPGYRSGSISQWYWSGYGSGSFPFLIKVLGGLK